ncbi:cellulose biosynthesis protein BcsS [uncultured Methylobacterium sp.]|uniref:cellulose biosynthesis protein BcsS n=1 Tax=uncultured Methylobacterium sp. TaxID=157278 RepID=UPI0035CBEA08
MAGTAIRRVNARRSRRLSVTLSTLLVLGHGEAARGEENPISAILFGSLDAAPSGFATAGAKIAFDRVDREGFVVLASVGAGRRTETGPSLDGRSSPSLMRWTMMASALAGHQWFTDWGVIALYAGPEGSMEALSGSAGTAILPARFGLRLHGEVWAYPTDETLLTATLILGSAHGHAWGRLSYGVRFWGAYLGPEAALYADETGYRKWSIGLHATDVSVGRFSLRVSAGYMIETPSAEGSPYVALTLWTPL